MSTNQGIRPARSGEQATTPPAGRRPRLPGRVRDDARSTVYWGAAHGLPRVAVRTAARRGDLQGRLIVAGAGGGEVWDAVEQVRAAGPLYRGRFAFLTVDHAVTREVLASGDFRAGSPVRTGGLLGGLMARTAPDLLHPMEPPSLLVTEPPMHTRHRQLVSRVFTARAVQNLRARTEQIASELLDGLVTAEPVDLVAAYCALLPVTVISEILGVPPGERPRVLALGSAVAPSLDFGLGFRQFRSVTAALRDFESWLTGHLARLRREPGDDLLSQLIVARDQDGGLDEGELKSIAGLVLAAGFETTVNLLGNGIALLSRFPEQLGRLRGQPELWPGAVEEILRIDPPVLLTGRISIRDLDVRGVAVPAGSYVVTVLAGANRDPKVFAEPETFDVARANARDHVSFSAGRHFCLGASLARMEGEVGLRAFFDRYPDVTMLPGARRRANRVLRGWSRLPARLS
ncbi:cytochrome P450 [Pseudofrankia sp. BMG5.36]|uniref:cytochrome P450 n=1 Tax=Pseudofrankia sp. BMG5.36 TaxID=1834512 RepID=UPI000AAD2E38|nr:cytochrome P450 [Pseudofrankia sp. BMG5.36]